MDSAIGSPAVVPAALRRWGRGLLGLEAAVELLLRAFGGVFAEPSWPWIASDQRCVWLDAEQIRRHVGTLSDGEQRVLTVVEALATGAPVGQLPDVLAGLDRRNLELVLAALAHAGGSHTHACLTEAPDGSVGWHRLPPLIGWPETDRAG